MNGKVQEIEHRFEKETNPRIVLTITTDTRHRIVNIRNPYGITHPFYRGHIFNKHTCENWCACNGFVEKNTINKNRPMKPNEIIKDMIKNPHKYPHLFANRR